MSALAYVAAAGCGAIPAAPGWKVDVINGNGVVQVGITTDREGWAWIVPAGAQIVLLHLPEGREGTIEVIDRECRLLDTARFSSTSFTIVLEPVDAEPPDVKLRLKPGASLAGAANDDYETWCSG